MQHSALGSMQHHSRWCGPPDLHGAGPQHRSACKRSYTGWGGGASHSLQHRQIQSGWQYLVSARQSDRRPVNLPTTLRPTSETAVESRSRWVSMERGSRLCSVALPRLVKLASKHCNLGRCASRCQDLADNCIRFWHQMITGRKKRPEFAKVPQHAAKNAPHCKTQKVCTGAARCCNNASCAVPVYKRQVYLPASPSCHRGRCSATVGGAASPYCNCGRCGSLRMLHA
jgi:hypothetical protein